MKVKIPDYREIFLLLGNRKLVSYSQVVSKTLFYAAILSLLIGLATIVYFGYSLASQIKIRSSLLEKPEVKPVKTGFFRRVNLKQVEQVKLFGALAPAKTKIEAPVAVEKPKLNLIATFVDPKHRYAILESGASQLQEAFEEGEKVFNVATLASIKRGKVELRWPDGSVDVLEIDESTSEAGAVSTGERAGSVRRISLSRVTLNEFLDDITVFATQARVIPFFQDGKPVGLRIFGIATGGVYEFLGFENGDIVKSIDNISVNNVSDFTNLVKQLREKSRISVLIERNRENVEIVYDIN